MGPDQAVGTRTKIVGSPASGLEVTRVAMYGRASDGWAMPHEPGALEAPNQKSGKQNGGRH